MQDVILKVWFDVTNRIAEIRDGDRGATAVEYGIMVALIAVVIIVAVRFVGSRTSSTFNTVGRSL